jgi:hypothetical protein
MFRASRDVGPCTTALPTIRAVKANGPGLAKVRHASLLRAKERVLVALTEGAVRDWLERADVMSEGRTTHASDASTYYGSTSIVLPLAEAPLPRRDDSALIAALAACPHLRLRALRIARREAEVRAGASLDTVRAEITTHRDARGLVVAIEVEAPALAALLALHP